MTPVSSFLTIHLAFGIWSTLAEPVFHPNIHFDELQNSQSTAIPSNPASFPSLDWYQSKRFKATSYDNTPVTWQTDAYLSPHAIAQSASGQWSDVNRYFGQGSGTGIHQHQGQIVSHGSWSVSPTRDWPQAGMNEQMNHITTSWPLDSNNEPRTDAQREHDHEMPLEKFHILESFFDSSHQDPEFPDSQKRTAPSRRRSAAHLQLEEQQSPSAQHSDDVPPNAPFTRLEQITDVTGISFTLEVQSEKLRLRNRRSPPHKNLDLDFLKHQNSMYDEQLTKVYKTLTTFRCLIGAAAAGGDNLPVRFWRDKTSWYTRVMTSRGKCIAKENLMLSLELFIKWMWFNNTIFYHNLGEPMEAIENIENELFRWLFQQIFGPDYGLPVIGPFQRNVPSRKKMEHGPVQKWLIKCLSTPNHTFIASVAIIGLWYKTYKGELWIFEDKKVVDYWRFMDTIVHLALDPKEKTAPALGKPNKNRITIRERLLDDCPFFDANLVSALSTQVFRLKKCKEENGLRNPKDWVLETSEPLEQQKAQFAEVIKGIHERMQGLYREKDLEFEDVLVALLKSPGRWHTIEESIYSLRLMQRNFQGGKGFIRYDVVETRIKVMIDLMHIWHNKIQNYRSIDTQCRQLNAYYLLNWVHQEIISPHGSLPLFGNHIPKKDINLRGREAFGKVQLMLLQILTKSSSLIPDWNYCALSILGYWYKQKFSQYWNMSFKDDKGFWSIIISHFGAKSSSGKKKRKFTPI